jgi:zinc protease
LLKSGEAHFLEHLACENHKRKFSSYLDDIGAENNAFTSFNTICFYEIFPKECLEKVLSFESERIRSLEIEDKVFQNEKQAILEERGMRIDANVHGRNYEVFASNVFNRQVGGIYVIGWKHEIESIQVEDLKAYYKKWIVPNNATLILVGDFDKEIAKQLIKKYFEEIPSAKLPQKISSPKKIDGKKSIECRSTQTGSSTIKYTYQVPFLHKNNLRKAWALSLALEVLEQPSFFVNGILNQMTDTVSGFWFLYNSLDYEYDILDVAFRADTIDNLEKAEKSWSYFRKKILNGCVNEEELQKIKKKKLIALAYKKEDINQISNHFGWNLMYGFSLKEILSVDNLIQSITVKECNDVLKEVFSTSPIFVMKTLPKGYDRD